jgi:hypothetical protein
MNTQPNNSDTIAIPQWGNLLQIHPDVDSSWENRIFLTLDLDWADESILAWTIDWVDALGIPATWFVTHPTPHLERLRSNPLFTLGIHPNFNPLLNGISASTSEPQAQHAEDVLKRILEIVPEAKVVRSHSMTQNSRLLHLFSEMGLVMDCNHFIPVQSGIALKPYRHWDHQLIRVPYCWEDDVYVLHHKSETVERLISHPGLKVIDFHPIHLFLNTADMAVYEACRPYHYNYQELKQYIANDGGVRDFLSDLVALTKQDTLFPPQTKEQHEAIASP